mgnify:CR=1 FL=1
MFVRPGRAVRDPVASDFLLPGFQHAGDSAVRARRIPGAFRSSRLSCATSYRRRRSNVPSASSTSVAGSGMFVLKFTTTVPVFVEVDVAAKPSENVLL